MPQTFIKLHNNDDVLIATRGMPAGKKVHANLTCLDEIPPGHKIARHEIKRDNYCFYPHALGYSNSYLAIKWIINLVFP